MTGVMILEALFQPEEVRMCGGGPGGRCPDDDPRMSLSESAPPDSTNAEPEEPAGNELSGVVHGSAVQARNIHGDVHFSVTRADPAAMPVPAQLPPATAHFTGRSEELAALNRATAEYDPAAGGGGDQRRRRRRQDIAGFILVAPHQRPL